MRRIADRPHVLRRTALRGGEGNPRVAPTTTARARMAGALVGVLAALLLAVGICGLTPARAAGDFHIVLTGTQRISKAATTSDGSTSRRVDLSLHTTDGYPRLAINVGQARETLLPEGQTKAVAGPNGGQIEAIGTLDGQGSASDPTGGTPLFDLRLRGAILADHTLALGFTSPATDTSSHLSLIAAFPSSEDASLQGAATGTLVLAPDTDAGIVAHVWGGPAAAPPAPKDDPTLWYLTRGAASTAYLLLVAVVALGIALGFRGFEGLLRGWRALDLHQALTLLMLAFVGLHLATLFLDPFKPFTLLQLAWPLAETYRPIWTALGVLALYLLLAVTASSYLRRALGNRAWFALHLTSYVAFVLLTLHGIFAGTDSATPWMLGVYVGSGALVLLLTLARVYFALAARRDRPRPALPSETPGPVEARR